MDNFKPQYMEIDLEKVISEKDVGLIMGSGDEEANKFIVSVKRGGKSVELDGFGVVGYLIMPNDETIRIPGSVEDNKAVVGISKNGYVYDGAFQLAVKLVVGAKENTIAIFHGKNARTTSENISDGEKVIYGVKDILAMIDNMKKAETDANTAATSANNAAASANSAASKADTATSNANAATTAANNAAQTATTAAGNANNATSAANNAAQTANNAAGRAEAVASKSPYIGDNGNWYVFDVSAGAYVDSGFPSRGIPGQGAVSTVNEKQPDAAGNVQIDANDVNALAKDGTAADASKLGGVAASDYLLRSAAEELVGCKLELMWKNSAPTSQFGASTVNIDAEEGDLILILYANSTTGYYKWMSLHRADGSRSALNITVPSGTKMENIVRDLYIYADRVAIDDCTYRIIGESTSSSVRNTTLIPIEIYKLV